MERIVIVLLIKQVTIKLKWLCYLKTWRELDLPSDNAELYQATSCLDLQHMNHLLNYAGNHILFVDWVHNTVTYLRSDNIHDESPSSPSELLPLTANLFKKEKKRKLPKWFHQ